MILTTRRKFRWRDLIWVALFLGGFVLFMWMLPSAEAQGFDEESIQACACEGLEQEFHTDAGTYADCVSDTHAIEIESTEDWAEAIGQSLHYAEQTGKRAKVLFFCEAEDTSTCYRHQLRFESTLGAFGLPIDWEYVPDQCVKIPDRNPR